MSDKFNNIRNITIASGVTARPNALGFVVAIKPKVLEPDVSTTLNAFQSSCNSKPKSLRCSCNAKLKTLEFSKQMQYF